MSALVIPCHACGQSMDLLTSVAQQRGQRAEVYRCPTPDCGLKAAVIFEPAGGMSVEDRSFVEREIARHGAFFPSDYKGPRGLR